jgi:hypothetical protein
VRVTITSQEPLMDAITRASILRSHAAATRIAAALGLVLSACHGSPAQTTAGGGGATGTAVSTSAGTGGGGTTTSGSGGTGPGGLRWIGRVDASNPSAAKFAWSGSGLVAIVNGAQISVTLQTEGATSAAFF